MHDDARPPGGGNPVLGLSLLRLALTVAQARTPPPPQPTPEPSPADLAEIERAVEADKQAQHAAPPEATPAPVAGAVAAAASSMNPDISLIADVALAAFSDDEPLQTRRPRSAARTASTCSSSSCRLRKAVDPYFRFDAQHRVQPVRRGDRGGLRHHPRPARQPAAARRPVPDPVRPASTPPTPTPGTSSTSRSRSAGCSAARATAGSAWSCPG